MLRLFVGNFLFEHELASSAGWQASGVLQRMSAERAVSWIALADDGDLIWTPEPIPDEFWDSLAKQGLPRVRGLIDLSTIRTACEVVPWGWSQTTCSLAARHFADHPFPLPRWGEGNKAVAAPECSHRRPSDSAVRKGNSREWSFGLEHELGVALPGAARIERLEDFVTIVSRSASELGELVADHAWVIKANFGMAGRERLLGRGMILTPPQRNWLSRRLQADGVVFIEPWLQRRMEVGIQWTLPPLGQGQPKLEALVPLLCDSQGGYCGSEFSLDTSSPREWQHAVEVSEQAAERLQNIGYFGPLGIDAAVYEDSAGAALVRPLQDINARYTMGRLALGFRRLLQVGERGIWRHGRVVELAASAPTETVREINLTPRTVGNRPPTHGSRLWIGSRSLTSRPEGRGEPNEENI